MTKRAIIYARLSPTPRGEEAKGGNLDQQVTLSQTRCDTEGWTVVDTITEKDTSATSKKVRKGWERAVELVRSGQADIIVSRHYDRMYRKVRDLEELCDLAETTGVSLIAVEAGEVPLDLTTATGRAQARFMAVGAQLETDIKAERQKLGHQRRVAAGRPFWGTRPFGFEKDGSHREAEAEPLRQAYSDVLAGHSLWGIAERWNKTKIPTRTGTPWRTNTVRQVLLHPRNAAIHTHTPDRTAKPMPSGFKATWEPIVSHEIFDAVTTVLNDPARMTGGGGKRKGLLTFIARCGKCEGPMGQAWNPAVRQDGTRLRKYQCRDCRGVSIPADFLDDYVISQIVMRADNIVAAKLANDDDQGLAEAEVAALRAKEVALRRKKDEWMELFNADAVSREDMLKNIAKVNAELSNVVEILSNAVTSRVSSERWRQDVEAMFANITSMYGANLDDIRTGMVTEDEAEAMNAQTDHERLREIITDATAHLRVLPRGKGKRLPGPEDVDLKLIELVR